MTQEEIKQKEMAIIEEYNKMKGKRREFGQFYIAMNDDLSIEIGNVNGWKIVYDAMTETWVVLSAWLYEWDSNPKAKESVDGFVKAVIFPTSVRLSDIDKQYVDDIVSAHFSLAERNAKKEKKRDVLDEDFGPEDDENEESHESKGESAPAEPKKAGFFSRLFGKK